MARVVVIGAGVGGLSAAIRLGAAGHEVTVLEQGRAGGKLGSEEIDGFHFDTGPSLLTLPHVFEELFAGAGAALTEHVDLVRLTDPFLYRWADGSTLPVSDDAATTHQAFARFATGGYEQWQRMWNHTQKVWDVSERTFFAGPMGSPRQLMTRMRTPRDLLHIDSLVTLNKRGKALFDDTRLQQWWNRYATYSGSSPFSAPATLGCIPYIEQQFGAWHVDGGVGKLAGALLALAQQTGVQVREGCAVQRVLTDADARVTGVRTSDGDVGADVVVANVDAMHLYEDLLPHAKASRKAKKAGRSSSVFAMMLGVEGPTEAIAHHNVWFTGNQRREFSQIFGASGVPDDPTLYVCNSSVTDRSQAPEGNENWFVLVNVGPGATTDWTSYGDRLIQRMNIEGRVRVRRDMSPQDIQQRWSTAGGAIYGSSSNGKRSAFLRAANRGPLKGLYLCGGSSHPGGGLPLVAMSGKIVAQMVNEDWPRE